LFFAFTHTKAIYINALDYGQHRYFINVQGSVAKSNPEEWRYLYRFHPRHEILMPLHEIFKTSKKQDLTPFIGQRVDILHEFC